MSKMSQLHMELSEQAAERGFESLDDALAHGYEIDTEAMGNGVARLCIDRELEEAHEAWLKKKERVLDALKEMRAEFDELSYKEYSEVLTDTIEFIRSGEV